MLNVDTHILLYALLGELTPRESRIVSRQSLGVSAIVLWEIAKLHQKGRITLSLDNPELIELLKEVHVWPITREVCLKLAELDFTSDPANELIAGHQPGSQRPTAHTGSPHPQVEKGSAGLGRLSGAVFQNDDLARRGDVQLLLTFMYAIMYTKS